MCAPDHFGVTYVINPWMEAGLGKTDTKLTQKQWNRLRSTLSEFADIVLLPPQPGLPDLVFTANAGMVLGKTAIVSRFKSKERQGEEPFFHTWFRTNGFEIAPWPEDVFFEGAGDALLDRGLYPNENGGEPIIWMGYGFRSDLAAAPLLEKFLLRKTVALKLVDPRFYHLDTCLCPLAGGYLMYVPTAFDDVSQKIIESYVPVDKRIILGEADAVTFACNAVDIGGHVVLNQASTHLQDQIRRAGFTPIMTPLTEFLNSGGAAKCLTLKLLED
jgi:N-dimethylarginine dimethylaminohydrolase